MATSYVIPHIKALARHPQRDEAQALLLRLSNQILPILTQRQFRVKQLLEFFPKNPQLLGMNVNRGFKIYIRCEYNISTPKTLCLLLLNSVHADT
jgi:hypothetical protein